VGFGNPCGFAQIQRLKKEESGNGPCIVFNGGVFRPLMNAFRRKNIGVEIMACAVLALGPRDGFLGTALLVNSVGDGGP
jgi:hypothetical protein